MPALDKNTLREELKRCEFRPAYLLYGPETYLRDGAAKYISQQAFGEGDFRDLNETTFELTTDPDVLRQAIGAAEQLPMMATRRLVRITGVRISATGFRDTVLEEHEDLLKSYFERPSPSSVVVLIADELNGNRKMSKLLKDLCAAVEFGALTDAELLGWARREFDKLGSSASDAVIRSLVARVGPDLHRLSNETSKVAAAALPSGVVTEELIGSLVATSREISNFALTDQLVAGRGGKALSTLKRLLDDGVEPLALLGAISFAFRRLVVAKDMVERGVPRADIARRLGGHPASHEQAFAAARRTDMASLTKAVQEIARTDIAIKTSLGGSTTGSRMQIEMLVAKLALLSSN
jgi:DNA polymerase-3 subunit delta